MEAQAYAMDPKKDRPIEGEDPFEGLKIGNWMILDEVNERQPCLKCKKSRKYFCYNCYIPVQDLQRHVPKVKLPIKIDIIKHSREIDGKSTAAHAAVLSSDVNIYTYPCIPDYGLDEKVVLVFPGKNAVSVGNLFSSQWETQADSPEPKPKRLNVGAKLPVTKAIFIDSTWNQSRGIYKDQRLRDLPCVVLQSRISQFWRHQNGSPRWYLATVEAIHQFLVELHTAAWERKVKLPEMPKSDDLVTEDTRDTETKKETDVGYGASTDVNNPECANNEQNKITDMSECFGPYDGEYDNLLFFFRYMYSKIHKLYDHEDLRAYKRPLK
ncbi:hypothetical protein ANN_25301 [Periplaneta americana]|uniref:tRNA-uridine aminocarboxypropyltransferase 1 n=1 Tax=Periplaneta americana TaxID=6978 RepID=A0ABQ8S137_PERAM|nr:hypothetical protein ANN_25301 [Periplaneta americana]